MTVNGLVVRKATSDDASTLLGLVDGLAEYEHLPPPDDAAKARLISDMCKDPPRFEAYLAEVGNNALGYAVILETYSSFLALPTLYLEDIFILPEHRGKGIGYSLFKAIVAEARRRGCGRMEWAVLDWNRPAIDFYERLGAVRLKEWNYYRLTREDFDRIIDQ